MRLGTLIDGLGATVVQGTLDAEIRAVLHDSRRIEPGALFVAIRGFRQDGHAFLEKARRAGAAAVLVAEDAGELPALAGCAVLRVADTRRALAQAATRLYGDPSAALQIVGVTGTNGKTTTACLAEAIFRAGGRRAGLLGTIGYRLGEVTFAGERTTPESSDLQALLRRMVDLGAEAVAMEVSSHALALSRVEGCEFDAAVFTNLTQDHLDFHGTMEAYYQAKAILIRGLGRGAKKATEKVAVLNRDDPWAGRLRSETSVRVLSYGLDGPADLSAVGLDYSLAGIRGEVRTPWGPLPIASRLVGRHNARNILAAAGACLHLGVPIDAVARGITGLEGVPGRFEKVEAGQPFGVVVDYAHTPDALERVLRTAREYSRGRLFVVFGCGGDRDRTKRPLMGEVAARLADVAVLTSDNPRSEEPAAIVDEIEAGTAKVPGSRERSVKIVDRREAIAWALGRARTGDLVLLAGKGHETYQIIGARTLPFDDRQVARDLLRDLGYTG